MSGSTGTFLAGDAAILGATGFECSIGFRSGRWYGGAGDGNDWLTGAGGVNPIESGAGNDTIAGGVGVNNTYGEFGDDLILAHGADASATQS